MVVVFTMMNGEAAVRCAVTTVAMDDLDRPFKASGTQREAQFAKLRERIEECAARKFLDAGVPDRSSELTLRSIDFMNSGAIARG